MELFRVFDEVSDWCWDSIETWHSRAQRTMGEKLIRAADSICANLVEGDGRYGVKDGINFLIIARASARETRQWLRKAVKRKLVSEADGTAQIDKLVSGTRLLSLLITYRRKRGDFVGVREAQAEYNQDVFAETV